MYNGIEEYEIFTFLLELEETNVLAFEAVREALQFIDDLIQDVNDSSEISSLISEILSETE